MPGVPGMVVSPEGIAARARGRWGRETYDERLRRRFWSKVDTTAGLFGCWPWQGTRDRSKLSYGAFRIGRRMVKAHRVSLELALGRPISPGLMALHSCDNPPCVNPAHLSEGTGSQNQYERAERRPLPRPTRCQRGHPFEAPHVRVRPNGRRTCGTCENAKRRARRSAA